MLDKIESMRKEIQELAKQYQDSQAGLKLDAKTLETKLSSLLGEKFDDPAYRHAVANLVTEIVYDTVSQYDLTGLLQSRTFGINETPVLKKRGKLRVSYIEHGANAMTTHQFVDEFYPTTRPLSGAPSYNYDEFKSGRYGDFAEQTKLINQEFLAKKNKLVMDTLAAAIPSTSGYGNYAAAAGGLTATILNKGLDYVNGCNTGGVKAIIGLYRHCAHIMDFTSTSYLDIFPETYKEKFMRLGMIDLYRGAPVIALKQYVDGDGLYSINPFDVFILGADDWGRWVEHGPFDTLEQVDATNRQWILNMLIKIGMYVWDKSKNYRIVVSGY